MHLNYTFLQKPAAPQAPVPAKKLTPATPIAPMPAPKIVPATPISPGASKSFLQRLFQYLSTTEGLHSLLFCAILLVLLMINHKLNRFLVKALRRRR